MNNVSLIGNLVRDNDLKYTSNNKAVLKNTIAVKRDYKNANGEYESDFISIVAFGSTAELLSKYTDKGSKVGVVGKITTGSYDDQDGKKRYTTDVIVNNITLLGQKKKEENIVYQENQESQAYQENDNFDSVSIDDSFLD